MDSITLPETETLAALALDLVDRATAAHATVVFVDATGDRLDDLAAAARVFDPALAVHVFPAWDSLPYDRAPPSAEVVGTRVATLAHFADQPEQPALVLTSARAVLARVPPPQHWAGASIVLTVGQSVDTTVLTERLHTFGYVDDEHIDAAGQVAVRGQVIDIFPGDAATPFRLLLAGNDIEAIHPVDRLTQRSTDDQLQALTVRPVIDVVTDQEQVGGLVCMLQYFGGATILLHHDVEARWADMREQIDDAYAATARARRSGTSDGPDYLPPPSQLFAQPDELASLLGNATTEPMLGHATVRPPLYRPAAIATGIRGALAAGRTVVAAGAGASRLHAALTRRNTVPVRMAKDWQDAVTGPAESAAILAAPLDQGCVRNGVQLIAAPTAARRSHAKNALTVDEPPRVGDIMVHRDHGICRLRGLVQVGAEERVALEFAGDTELLVPTDELDRLWRYGSETGHQSLDRVDGEAWRHREQEIAAEIATTAQQLAAETEARSRLAAPVIEPPATPYARFVRRFPYPLSPDQADAIEVTLADLRAGRPMDRLICGDVGFGKTEIALRAAAAVALAGYQVAIVAPTTVLARQHFDTFTSRFAGLGVRVEPLLRGATTAEGKAVRAGLADGSITVVVGTQAVAAEGVRFKRLGLVVIDEEQRFGDAHKKRLATMRNAEGGVHALVMTATPIPRTLQTAMVGLRQISVIATAPVRRRPTRTFVLPWDGVIVREALLREQAAGGQSFVVCPRIEDTGPLATRLAELVPELSIVTAHGRMKPQALEQVVSEFAAGTHDVLLATNIIEAGLDIPRANTIIITRPDRFGLSQLHQMRGRVGRGSRRSFGYLLSEGDKKLAPATQRRLQTLQTQEQLGAGITISLADMDARGAGDLFGDRQAGHVHAIGTELYQHLLSIELAAGRGEPRPSAPPSVNVEVAARIPEDLVAAPNLRLELYRRLARLATPDAAVDLADEWHDRFGELPDAVQQLLDLARLRAWCTAQRVVRLDAGPQAVAMTLEDAAAAAKLATALDGTAKESRVIIPLAVPDPIERLAQLCQRLIP